MSLENGVEHALKTNGYQAILSILQEHSLQPVPKEQSDRWVNNQSTYGLTKSCEIQLEGRCVAEISSAILKSGKLVPSASWILVLYDGFPPEIMEMCKQYFVNVG